MKNNIAVIGLSVMGKNLALNIADKGYKVSVFNRTTSVMEEMIKNFPHQNIQGKRTLKELVESLEKPRKIIIMVKAGGAVDSVINQLLEFVEKDDIIIDGGNSFFKDSERRYKTLKEKNINFFGVGISGGEEGARKGPAIMPGGDKEAYNEIKKILEDISAKVNGNPCINYTSTGGAGHYVKMVHNGIEYGDMEIIAESYHILKNIGGFTNPQISDIFAKFNKGKLKSYLIDITSKILKVKDPDADGYLIDKILDKSGQKGTGKWTTIQGADLGSCISVISSALNARYMSSIKDTRILAEKEFKKNEYQKFADREKLITMVENSLYTAKIISYAQGFSLLRQAEKEYSWTFNYADIAKIFRGGCIIQAKFLQNIIEAYQNNPKLENLVFDTFFKEEIKKNIDSLRELTLLAIKNELPIMTFTSALSYFDTLKTARLSANMIQAQRDYFGAHTFNRIDKQGVFHYDWLKNN